MMTPRLNSRRTLTRHLAPALAMAAWTASFAFTGALTGCAHTKSQSDRIRSDQSSSEGYGDSVSSSDTQDGNSSGGSSSRSKPIIVTSNGDLIVRGIKLKNTKFDYPISVNSRVEYWVDYFTGRGRKHFVRYLERSELFIPYIRPILRANGMPEDLVYLAMIESGFNNHARSSAKAVGPWQFMPATGKRYGLMVNWWVDERRDTNKSTLAAVGYLKDLHGMFQSWELAAAAYNAGEAKVARAIRRFGTKDFWALSRHSFLRPETRDYVPKIMAAAIVAKNRTQFGFPASTIQPGVGEAVAGDGEVVKVESEAAQPAPLAQKEALASVIKGDDYETLEEESEDLSPNQLVPATLSSGMNPPDSPVIQPLARPVPTPLVDRKGDASGEELSEFEVRSPADLLKVARAAGLSYHTVKSLNPEILRWCTPPNVGNYKIKLPVSVKDKFLSVYNQAAFPKKVQFMAYKVRKGENLQRIAHNFGIKVDPIADLNGVSPKLTLRKGALVLLPMPNDRSRTLSSLEIRDPPEKVGRHGRRHRRGGARSYKVSYKKREAARSRGRSDES
ncbi:MAG: transglycosylase SLT domain-containing protein [Methylotenera sp.]|nr:transglycosylase SLT domain-containing protein [Oligoflexia bacterium]